MNLLTQALLLATLTVLLPDHQPQVEGAASLAVMAILARELLNAPPLTAIRSAVGGYTAILESSTGGGEQWWIAYRRSPAVRRVGWDSQFQS